jgi:hypothetical protein
LFFQKRKNKCNGGEIACVRWKSIYMKRNFLFLAATVLLLSACMKDSVTEHYTFYRPIYQTTDAVKNNIKSSEPAAIQQPGKIVFKDHYLFLNEIDRGIHVIDIANPAKPVNIAFINIPGCVDLAINGSYLYADCYVSLAAIDISDPLHVTLKQFLNGVFPQRVYQNFIPDTTKVITQWVRVDTAVSKTFSGDKSLLSGGGIVFMSSGSGGIQSAAYSSSGIGIAGSLARFGLLNNRMYTVSNSDLKVFNIAAAASPSFVSSVSLQQGNIETIFPYKDKLFIGAQSGMFVYETSNADKPKKYSQFTHARSCDPVIADDQYAYVTLSGGSACGGYTNQLDVVDISNLASPALVKSYGLTSPKGLSKDGNLLLICDGKDGLKIMNAANASQVSLVKQVTGFESTDVIALQGIAIVVAKDGLYFVDYSNVNNASVIGKMQINKSK